MYKNNRVSDEPECWDEVKHKTNDMSGIVIAKFMMNGRSYLDVRCFDGRVRYNTPASNWLVINTEEERVE